MSHLSDAFNTSDPNALMNSAHCPMTMNFTPVAGHPGARYIREDVALATAARDVDEAIDCAIARGFVTQVAGQTVWVDAPDPEVAIHNLLDGVRVYDSRDLAIMMTGRAPVCLRLIARSYP